MKKSIFTIAVFMLAILFSNETVAQKFPKLDKSPMDAASYPTSWRISDKLVKMVYSRPQLKGRSLSKLAPNDKVWRTGANEAAEITFYKDVNFGGQDVKAGTYSLFTIPGDKEWTIILNNAKNVWGAYTYRQEDDVLRVKANVSRGNKFVEAFSIMFDGEDEDFNMYLGWGRLVVTVPVRG